MKKSTLADALSVNQKLLDLAEKASGDEKKEIEKARKTFCDLIVHLSGGIIQMSDAMDKQNDTIKLHQKALKIAADMYCGYVQDNSCDCGMCPYAYNECVVNNCFIHDGDDCTFTLVRHWLKEAEMNEVKS